ncbi:MAG TPA: beta-1,6-N-acetylglucosaminyltransferase [Clostridiaceae bacterium]|nr:beta-1,6-N-acetylglucosaminyltransferase [Clostridiaceae bacterium]
MKHAYLILAHNNFYTLKVLLKLLDNENNDIYIHIDKKTRNVPKEEILSVVQKSNLHWVTPIKTYWGHSSLVNAELKLIKTAILNGEYEYLHLISGVDLPLKKQSEIHKFFEDNKGKEFVGFSNLKNNYEDRVKYYYWLQKYEKNSKIIAKLQEILTKFQKILKVNRLKNSNINIQKGCQWVSITGDFAKYIIKQEKWIQKFFANTNCSDELLMQTILINSPFAKNIYNKNDEYKSCLREIDWERGSPYVWKKEDKDILLSSNNIFARKFDENVDKEIMKIIMNNFIER